MILTVRFEAVTPHPVVYLENPADGDNVYDPTGKTLTVLVNAGTTGKQVVFAEVSGGDSPRPRQLASICALANLEL